jgi:hypothetical protein
MADEEATTDNAVKTTVVANSTATGVCERLEGEGYFSDKQGAFRFAVCLALAYGLSGEVEPDGGDGGRKTTWSVTGLDPHQDLAFLVSEFSLGAGPSSQRDQYRQIEQLGNLGLIEIGRRLEAGVFISELLE